MACEDIKNRLQDLKAQKQELKESMQFLQGPGLQRAQETLDNLNDQIDLEEKNLEECRAIEQQQKNPTPRAFVGRVKNFFCAEASAEAGKDEPYLLIGSVDMLASLQVGPVPLGNKPAVHCFKVGPWSGVKANTWHPATELKPVNNPAFWDLNSQARIVNSPQDVAFLVSLVENDGGSPDAIRGAVETALGLSVVQNMGRDYVTFTSTLASAMAGAIDTASVAGLDPLHLNADDRIGNVHQLKLTTDDLDRINTFGELEKSLTFKSAKNSGKITNEYTVNFSFKA